MNLKVDAVRTILSEETGSIAKLESALTLVKGTNPQIDSLVEKTLKSLSALKSLQDGDILTLTTDNFPENTPEQKKRKKALIWFLKNFRTLQEEVKSVKTELEKTQNEPLSAKTEGFGKVLAFAKGPFGIITIAAVIISAASFYLFAEKSQNTGNQVQQTAQNSPKITVLVINNKKVPLSETKIGKGPECLTGNEPGEHYHALNGQYVTATDGTEITDPGGCGLGKVAEIAKEEIEASN